jgi:hypothetical protein
MDEGAKKREHGAHETRVFLDDDKSSKAGNRMDSLEKMHQRLVHFFLGDETDGIFS